MLSYEEFKKEVIEKLVGYLPPQFSDCTIRVERVPKVNRVMEGFVLEPPTQGQGIAMLPVLYFEPFYQLIRKGADLERVLTFIAGTITEYPAPEMLTEASANPQLRKEDAILQVINRRHNAEYLKGLPHRDFLDLAVIYRLMMQTEDHQIYSAVIDFSMMQDMGLTEEELFEIARRQMKQRMPYHMIPVCVPLFAYTNHEYCFGAASILEKAGIRRLARQLQDDLYILPASIHEMMLLPQKAVSYEMAQAMLLKANLEGTDPQEWLSDKVYVYRRAEDQIDFAKPEN